MSDHPFNRLAPFIQEWIYQHQWEEMRDVQVEAARVLFDTDDHLLLATGTASGKTEAAFFPALTLLQSNPSASVGILYIGPLKALINDQFHRLEGLLEEAKIPVWRWHGDVPASKKKKLLRNPSGVLQITPESLESLLLNRSMEIRNLFGDLRFIVIDEIHVFMNSQRGLQLLCLLERIYRITENSPRRIGLSATLGDYHAAVAWLSSGTPRSTSIPDVPAFPKQVSLAVEHFIHHNPHPSEYNDEYTSMPPPAPSVPQIWPAYEYIYQETLNQKSLIFTNSRNAAEYTIATLRQISRLKNTPDRYYVHHGNIAGQLREDTEKIMKSGDDRLVIGTTVTLELGIDIGDLERIIQLKAPFSVSSFLQRLGRSGRRTNRSELLFVDFEVESSGNRPLHKLIPWNLLQTIAIIQLFIKERWVEPLSPISHPFNLLYHQTMAILTANGEMMPQDLAESVLTLSPFKNISVDNFRCLLSYLIEINHIEILEEGALITGLEGEKIVRDYHFYAVFQDSKEYTVRSPKGDVGVLEFLPIPGDRIPLAGFGWEVTQTFPKEKLVFVKQIQGKLRFNWSQGDISIHGKILQEMENVLKEDEYYSYLQPGAVSKLEETRRIVRSLEIDKRKILPLANGRFCFFPWLGSKEFNTLYRILKIHGTSIKISNVNAISPYYLIFDGEHHSTAMYEEKIFNLAMDCENPFDLIEPSEKFALERFSDYIPENLKEKNFVLNKLELDALKAIISEKWKGT